MSSLVRELLKEHPEVWAAGLTLRLRDGRLLSVELPSGRLLIVEQRRSWWKRLKRWLYDWRHNWSTRYVDDGDPSA